MKHPIVQLLKRNIVADEILMRVVQLACFVAGVAVLALSIWKLTRLDLTEAQLFAGVLLALVTPLLLIVIGLLLPISIRAGSAKR
jgi:hypothetical protein